MKSHVKIALDSFEYYQNDGKFDADELKKLIDIALQDNVIDKDEKDILNEIVRRIKPEDIDAGVQEQLDRLLPLIQG